MITSNLNKVRCNVSELQCLNYVFEDRRAVKLFCKPFGTKVKKRKNEFDICLDNEQHKNVFFPPPRIKNKTKETV